MPRFSTVGLAILVTLISAAVSAEAGLEPALQQFPDVVAVKVRQSGADRFDFDATISSPYDTPQRYADAFRVVGRDGRIFGERVLLHDHANEQPFTRDLHGVSIPRDVRVVVVEARDRMHGYGGRTVEVPLPGR